MKFGLCQVLSALGLLLAVGCGGKAVTGGDDASTTRADGSGSGSTGTGGTGTGGVSSGPTTNEGSGGSTQTSASGGTGVGGSMSEPPVTPSTTGGRPDPEPPTEPPVMRPPPDPEPPDEPPTIPSDCVTDYQNMDRDWCEVSLQCDGRFAWTWCEGDGETAYCFCEGDRFFGDFELTGVNGGEACQTVAPFCVGGAQANFGELTCSSGYQEAGGGYCNSSADCTRSAELGDGITLQVRDYRSVWCQQNGSTWGCDCNSNFDYVRFDFEEGTNQICNDALRLCIDYEAEVSGPMACEPSRQSASREYCDAELDCTQAGSLGDTSVQIHSSVWLYCEPDGDAWRCNCQLPSAPTTFNLEGGDAWNTCQAASELCAEMAAQ